MSKLSEKYEFDGKVLKSYYIRYLTLEISTINTPNKQVIIIFLVEILLIVCGGVF